LKTLFSIGEPCDDADALLFEIGDDHCCYALVKDDRFCEVRYFGFDALEAETVLGGILDGIKVQPAKVVIGSAFAQALLVPQQLFKNDFSFSKLVFDLQDQQNLHDNISEWQMVTAYSMPAHIYKQLQGRFTDAQFCHVYTPSLKFYNGFVAEDQVDIHFSVQQFRVVVKKDNVVQLAQTYAYKTPLDVVYFLLKICYEFGLDQSHLFVIVSGLIDKDSSMYHELHHYFLNLHFSGPPSFEMPESNHPHYYFTSLYNLAACAS
jgi:hypothetical protein